MKKDYEEEEIKELHDWTENRKEKAYLDFEEKFADFCIKKGYKREELRNIKDKTLSELLKEFLNR